MMRSSWQIATLKLILIITLLQLPWDDPKNRSTPGLPAHQQFLEFTQTHVHRVSDATQTSHPLLSPSPPAPIPPSIMLPR